ncbi:DUF2301 domain-containing membrane protein [Pelagibaculum spongiae]|uniref:Uncharacterized protein n=1 Tax=Pelagibaculum spongiae TaxID=2080658 RepID=A0A2V1GV62_9GAMM|nr:DUF2301 domain-containing membrane protein [Pelagibaculum spongiae]PVZ68833.1 hypothetical protein DC094_11295 [Pelagibaculum spongiae]
MADPHIKPVMDALDYITVVIYRSGFVVGGIALLGSLLWGVEASMLPFLTAAAMCASSLHIYDKKIRSILQFAAWVGLLLASWQILPMLAFGAGLLVMGGLSYKEYFCFKVPGLQAMPIWVAVLWLLQLFDLTLLANIGGSACGGLLLLLAWKKWQMPLHFDIGDKSNYQI